MTTQNNKRAAKVTESPKRVKENPSPRAGADDSQGVTHEPALERTIGAIEQRLKELGDAGGVEALDADVLQYGREAQARAATALSAASYAIVYTWATGSLLNIAKACLPRGEFGKWRDAKATDLGISARTAHNWMKLAGRCSDVRALLVPGGTLTGAYRAAGVLPDPAEDGGAPGHDDDDDGGGDGGDDTGHAASPAERAFAALAKGRTLLRHLLESGTEPTGDERDRLEQEKAAYIDLFDNLLQQPIIAP